MSPAPTPPLRDVQRWVKTRITPGGPRLELPLSVSLNPQGGEPGEARLAVYAEGYLARMREALAETYEAVQHLVGERAFRQLAADYAARHPSHDYNLSLTGRHLPEFLPAHLLARRLPLLPDLARLEWAVSVAFHAPARDPVDPARLSACAPEEWPRVRLVFHPSVGVVESSWPVLDVWQARTTPRERIDINVDRRPQAVLVFRRGLVVRCELIEPAQAALVRGLLAGQPLGEACAGLAGGAAEDAPAVTRWCASWMAQGLVVDCGRAPA